MYHRSWSVLDKGSAVGASSQKRQANKAAGPVLTKSMRLSDTSGNHIPYRFTFFVSDLIFMLFSAAGCGTLALPTTNRRYRFDSITDDDETLLPDGKPHFPIYILGLRLNLSFFAATRYGP